VPPSGLEQKRRLGWCG